MLAVDFSTEIRYSRETRDYDLFIDGEYVGSAASYGEGRHILDQIVLDKLTHGDHLTATQLDSGNPDAVSWSDRGDPQPPARPTCPACQTYLEVDDTCRFCAMVERMHDTTVSPPTARYVRHYACDRRFAHGDDFAADAWRDTRTGAIRFVAVGHIPDEPDPDDAPEQGTDVGGVPGGK